MLEDMENCLTLSGKGGIGSHENIFDLSGQSMIDIAAYVDKSLGSLISLAADYHLISSKSTDIHKLSLEEIDDVSL